ncbi:ankyrin repeats (many copies) domain-containing protein [Hirsutella rhossiliensis]|uniref:Ankyrin repeats (Many copies) domain-containing protein n=1 Tax=Hirsutella rhossiliensis TaxID=111463 RepID=A0A9P8MQ58_9HYPO|nr:ankyrin repeats (many copies) domain-containing protein [Hirsutella rhossiliensis]KAH0959124.1 ankyrin repeats (many copies) domain-containing protein [Hirsutella rhossiliensis]
MLTHACPCHVGERRKRHSSQLVDKKSNDSVTWTQPYTIPRPPARARQEKQQQLEWSQPPSKSKTQPRHQLTTALQGPTPFSLPLPEQQQHPLHQVPPRSNLGPTDEDHDDNHDVHRDDAAGNVLFDNNQPSDHTSDTMHLKDLLWLGELDKLSGYNALHLAAYYGQASIVRLLLKTRPADVDLLTDHGQSALHIAIAGLHVDVVVALLDYGADLVLPDNLGRTPLHVAVMAGAHDAARLLVDRRLECLHVRDVTGCTPLHVAVMLGHDDVVRLFLGRGGAPSFYDSILVAS